ncbi:MAG: transcription-repair coupling factor [Fibrobacterales bacterium]
MKEIQTVISEKLFPSFARIETSTEVDLVPHLSGFTDVSKAACIAQNYSSKPRRLLVLCPDVRSADSLADDLGTFVGDEQVVRVPELELNPYEWRTPFTNVVESRLHFLNRLNDASPFIAVATLKAALEKMADPAQLKATIVTLSVGGEIEFDDLRETLMIMGFSEEPMVENIGEFSIRGCIVDIYPFLADHPLRLEFLDTEIESIREFDIFSQLSRGKKERMVLMPMEEFCYSANMLEEGVLQMMEAHDGADTLESVQTSIIEQRDFTGIHWMRSFFQPLTHSIFEVMGSALTLFYTDNGEIQSAVEAYHDQLEKGYSEALESGHLPAKPTDLFYTADELDTLIHATTRACFTRLSWNGKNSFEYTITDQQRSSAGIQQLDETSAELQERGYKVYLVSSNQGQAERLKKLVSDMAFSEVLIGHLSSGFVVEDEKVALFTDHQIFNKFSRKVRQQKYKGGVAIPSFEALTRGDCIIHQDYGIGKYIGIQRIEIKGGHIDCILLEYSGKDRLTVPVEDLQKLEKYVSKDGPEPNLNKLGTKTWASLKERTKKKVVKIAKELVELYAKRQLAKGHSFTAHNPLQVEFEQAFEYEPTPDQQSASEACKKDLEQTMPMDRLVCGDVGFGKTEVAMRAAFKVVCEKKQVAILVPTTILATQHFNSFVERLASWPVEIEFLNRFKSTKEKKEVYEKLSTGRVDIVVGTHALLSKDVSFKDLGLIIVDEEQKFGVKQKERLMELKLSVDFLCMSATPIPRTLHLSLAGARDVSLISTPPRNRLPIETRVMHFDKKVIRDAIYNEMNRGGQIFVVNDRVRTIMEIAEEIEELVPEARVCVGHGQMNATDLEQVMAAFLNREFDVLVSTTIIESGLDIPSANTMIINNAHNFGVSQLYQLRGRVGRSGLKAWAYLITPHNKVLSDDAQKRLKALEMFTDLGSGYQLALRDLEIRGAGNLLGTQQSGHIAELGYETYVKMIREAVNELRGEHEEPDIATKVELSVDSFIPESYVEDGLQRISLYQKIARLETMDEVYRLKNEFQDRYGDLPAPCEMLLGSVEMRIGAKSIGVEKVEIEKHLLVLTFSEFYKPKPEQYAVMMERCNRPIRLIYEEPIQAVVDLNGKNEAEKCIQSLEIIKKLAGIEK